MIFASGKQIVRRQRHKQREDTVGGGQIMEDIIGLFVCIEMDLITGRLSEEVGQRPQRITSKDSIV